MPVREKKESATLVTEKTKTRKPSLYKVILHNDDFTTMDFVVYILKSIFHHSHHDAIDIMITVHQKGSAICGVYPFDVAETKVNEVIKLARQNEFPLLCTMEKE